MRSLKRIESYEEFLKYYEVDHKYCYYGNRPIIEEKKQELALKYYQKAFKENRMYKTTDNYILLFKSHFSIDNDIYYDDETEDPGTEYYTFLSYNLKMNFEKIGAIKWDEEITRLIENGSCSGNVEEVGLLSKQYSRENSNICYVSFFKCFGRSERERDNFIRELTPEESQDIVEIEKEIMQEYTERLEKYYKKYKNKIYTVGYWANR